MTLRDTYVKVADLVSLMWWAGKSSCEVNFFSIIRILNILCLYIFIEGFLGESCVIAAADSCSDPNAQCVNDICECNEGYYDNDGISDNNAGTCILSEWLCSYLKDSVGKACANGLLKLIRSITGHLIWFEVLWSSKYCCSFIWLLFCTYILL